METKKLFDLTGKTALVTGSSSGIGEAIAIAMAQSGADIIGVAHDFEDGLPVEKEVLKLGRSFKKYTADFSNRESLYAFINAVKADGKPIDILVNNAGMIARKPLQEHDDATWDKVISVNLDAQYILSREFGSSMVERGYGKIIFTCSMLSYQGGINVVSYTASKSAVAGLAKAFANEWAHKGVNINGVAPGYISTANTAPIRADEARNKAILDRIPAGRWGTPEDLAAAFVFLASDAANYINGTILNVDGGWMAR